MTTIAFPDIAGARMVIKYHSNTRVFKSVFSGQIQTASSPGGYWAMSVDFPLLTEAQSKVLRAFQMSLDGQENRFYFRDFSFTGQADPAVTGTATQNSTTLTLSGSVTLLPGDYVQVGDELKMVISGSGTTYEVKPNFRKDMTATNINTYKPAGIFILDTNSVGWEMDVCSRGLTSISCIEAI